MLRLKGRGWQMSGGGLGFLGGIGLFVFGMFVMTEALKALASARMRAALARFTTTPALGVISGAVSTALLQSSSATILNHGFSRSRKPGHTWTLSSTTSLRKSTAPMSPRSAARSINLAPFCNGSPIRSTAVIMCSR